MKTIIVHRNTQAPQVYDLEPHHPNYVMEDMHLAELCFSLTLDAQGCVDLGDKRFDFINF